LATLLLGEMSDSNTGVGKVQYELGTFCCARKKLSIQRIIGENVTEVNGKGSH
jgi:hypothetical protein